MPGMVCCAASAASTSEKQCHPPYGQKAYVFTRVISE